MGPLNENPYTDLFLLLVFRIRSNLNTREVNTREIQFFEKHKNEHNSEPRGRTGTRIGGNESYGPPGAVATAQGPK